MKKLAIAIVLLAGSASAAKIDLAKGSTSEMTTVFIEDSSSTVGAGLTGLVFNSAGLGCQYYLEDAAASAAHALVTMTLGTWVSGGFVVVDATNMPGIYSIGLLDAALTGADHVVLFCDGATNMKPLKLEIQLTDTDSNDGVRGGMTALPNVAAGAAGGLADDTDPNGRQRIVDGNGAGEIQLSGGSVSNVTAVVTCTTCTNVTNDVGLNFDDSSGTLNASQTDFAHVADTGTAQAGAPNTITLRTGASAANDSYLGGWIETTGGTGPDQGAMVVAYVGATRVATVNRTWAVTPDATTTYILHNWFGK